MNIYQEFLDSYIPTKTPNIDGFNFIKARFLLKYDKAFTVNDIDVTVIKYDITFCDNHKIGKKCKGCKKSISYGIPIRNLKRIYSNIYHFEDVADNELYEERYPIITINSYVGECHFFEPDNDIPFDDHIVLYPGLIHDTYVDNVHKVYNTIIKAITDEIVNYNTRLLELIGARDQQFVSIIDIIKIAIMKWKTSKNDINDLKKFLKIINKEKNAKRSVYRNTKEFYDKNLSNISFSWKNYAGIVFDDINIFDLNDDNFGDIYYILRSCKFSEVSRKQYIYNSKGRCVFCSSYKNGNHFYDATKTKRKRMDIRKQANEHFFS